MRKISVFLYLQKIQAKRLSALQVCHTSDTAWKMSKYVASSGPYLLSFELNGPITTLPKFNNPFLAFLTMLRQPLRAEMMELQGAI